MTGFAFIAAGAVGVWLISTPGRDAVSGTRRMPRAATTQLRAPAQTLRTALAGVAAAAAGWTGAWALFGGGVAPILVAVLGGAAPLCAATQRQRLRARDTWRAWPRLLAEIRVLVAHRGQSIPAALFAAGIHAPAGMRPGFSDAARTWSLSTDFEASLRVLKASLADPTADAVCETLLAAHQIGGVRIDARLRALAEAAQAEAAARSDARAKQAGARFARSFVALVPAFMAVIGLSIGRGRQAYESADGQLLVAFSVLAVTGCWLWAGRIMAVPMRQRVFLQ
ncbi:type II secretion system F family protein [Candidatus Poriferisodalis sp.]|uniref:type II secretion system F family protein n=1 Tax=Candidatus Poriferisodalis sp. TaxID=3101277 RepID=UPI003B02E0CB